MDTNDLTATLRENSHSFTSAPEAKEAETSAAENALTTRFPDEHRRFLLWSNGGELVAREQAIDFWDATIATRHKRLRVGESLPGVLLVGSNEGEIALDFDRRENHGV